MPGAPRSEIGLPASLVPVLTAVLAAILTVIPLHLPSFAAITPAFVLMTVYYWALYRPELLPNLVVFLVGLLLDFLSGMPYLGISALILLLVRVAVMLEQRVLVNRAFPVLWLGFLLASLGAGALEWMLVCGLRGAFLTPRSFIFQAVLTVACFPPVGLALARLDRAFLVRD
ncbi:MAG TPA: rod shape-determining protein MreD [Stellaceae bacterium]|nr:rod shape-determining protein MreD [Stellaceae bacterium]